MDLTIQYNKHYAANGFRRTGTTGSCRDVRLTASVGITDCMFELEVR